MLDLATLLRVPGVETEMGFDISPDGKRLSFSWNPDGRWEIYELDLAGSGPPRQISRGPGGKFAPRYAPDGRSLAYAVDFDGSEQYHIVLHDFENGRQTDLTPAPKGSLQPFFAWSPDGEQIAYICDESGRFDVYVMSAAGGAASGRLVCDAGFPAWKVGWSPDGRFLAVVTEAEEQNYGAFVLPLDGGRPRRIGGESPPISVKDAAWAPDSRQLAFCSDVNGNYDIGLYDLASDSLRWLTGGEGQKQSPAWSPDGRSLAYTLTCGTVSWLAVQAEGGAPRLLQVEPGVHSHPCFTPDGRALVFCFDNARHPADLWLWPLEGDARPLTRSLPASLAGAGFPMPREVTYPGLDGVPVPALLFEPRRSRPGPAVLLAHGGPDWHFENTWYPLMAHTASRGWVVLVPNFRGSTGYGRAWQLASRFDYGGVDADDVAAGALYLAQEGLADPRRIALTGRSHGGYLTAVCLTRFPELWAAGSAVVPFLNWFTNHNEIRPDLQKWDLENFGDPVRDHDKWVERSPAYFLDRIQAPLQLICGRHDARCPVSDSIEAYERMKEMGKEVELIMYEDEGHAFLKLENILDCEQRRVDFLAKWLER